MTKIIKNHQEKNIIKMTLFAPLYNNWLSSVYMIAVPVSIFFSDAHNEIHLPNVISFFRSFISSYWKFLGHKNCRHKIGRTPFARSL